MVFKSITLVGFLVFSGHFLLVHNQKCNDHPDCVSLFNSSFAFCDEKICNCTDFFGVEAFPPNDFACVKVI